MITERDFWNHRSQNYDEQIGPQYERAYQLTAERTLAYLKPEDRVLDFACGTGIVTLEEAPHVKYVRAIDISDEMEVKAKQKMADHGVTNVEVTQTDLFDPCLEPASFDVVTAFNVLCYVEDSAAVRDSGPYDVVMVYNAFPHFPDPAGLIRTLAELVRPGGRLSIAHGMSRAGTASDSQKNGLPKR